MTISEGKVVYRAETIEYEIVDGEKVHTYRYFEDDKGCESFILLDGENSFRRFNKENPLEIEIIKLVAQEILSWDWEDEEDFSRVLRTF